MARLIGPSEASREVKTIVTSSGVTKDLFKSKAGRPAKYFVDPDPTVEPTPSMLVTPADIRSLAGVPYADSTVTIDAYSMLPPMQFPDGVDSLLIQIDGGPPWRVYAREDDRIDALGEVARAAQQAAEDAQAAAAAAQATASGRETPTGAQGKVDAHSADTTGVHGIADTSVLETQTGAQAKATAAQTAAISAASTDATTKANAAQSAATAAAATDATTKANAAQAAAVQRGSHTGEQAISTVTGLSTALSAKADLVGGVIPTAQIPALAINETFTVASQAAMLALTAQRGDVAVRTDLTPNRVFLLAADAPGTLANWKEITAAGSVTVVNGQSGAVTLAKGDLGLSDVDNTSDAAKPVSTATVTALLGKVGKGAQVISAGDYNIAGTTDGSVDSTNGFLAAIADLRPGMRLVVPPPPVGQHYKVSNNLPVSVPGIDIDGGGRSTEIRQYNRANKPVWDCLGVDYVSVHGFTFSLNGGPLTTIGPAFRAENGYTNCAAVWTNGSSNTIYDLRVKDFAVPVMLSAYDGVSAQSSTMRTGNIVRDLEISGANFGILLLCQDGLKVSGLNMYDAVDSSSGTNPLHAIYATGNSTLRHRNIVISDCVTRNVTFGCAYQTKYVDGLTMSNMHADQCQGIFNGIDITDVELGNLNSRRDTADVGSSFALQKVTTMPARITVNGMFISKTQDTVGSHRCMAVVGDDMYFSDVNLEPNQTVGGSNYNVVIRGARVVFDGLRMRNTGSAKSRSILVGTGSFTTSDVSIKGIEISNMASLVDFDTAVTGSNLVSYDPGSQRDISGTNYFNEFGGAASFGLSRREWTRTVAVTGGTTVTPVPALETATRISVGDSTAFTIAAPAGVARVGMSQDVVVVNATAGLLGTITWNAAYGLRSAFVPPVAGETHRITFTYDGTKWREVARSASAQPPGPESLATGEIIPAPDDILSNGIVAASGVVYVSYFTADKSEPINTLTTWSGGVAAAATPTLCRMGVYSVAANGDLTLVASTPNDTTLYAAINTAYAKGLSAQFDKLAGQRYALAVIVVSAATMPTFHGRQMAGTNPMNVFVRLAPAKTGRLLGQTDLPASIPVGSLVGYQARIAMQLS